MIADMASWNKSGGDGDDVELILRKLFVGGIKPDTSDDQFRNYFAKFGDIEVRWSLSYMPALNIDYNCLSYNLLLPIPGLREISGLGCLIGQSNTKPLSSPHKFYCIINNNDYFIGVYRLRCDLNCAKCA